MKMLSSVIAIAAVILSAIGVWIVMANKTVMLISPAGLLRLADTLLLLAITILLFVIASQKK